VHLQLEPRPHGEQRRELLLVSVSRGEQMHVEVAWEGGQAEGARRVRRHRLAARVDHLDAGSCDRRVGLVGHMSANATGLRSRGSGQGYGDYYLNTQNQDVYITNL
jgi:hypothetical protein